MPQYRETRFNTLSDWRQAQPVSFGISFRDQDERVLCHQFVLQHCATVTQIADDDCLRRTLSAFFPMVKVVQVRDYKVHVQGALRGMASRVQVEVESTDGERTWTTVGVSENILEASWQALADSYRLWLVRESLRHPKMVEHATEDYCWGV